ncbi:MAG TPA: TIGR00282 family metallophosphoesterase [Candidatus Saccharimonadales bacterium]|nr:TIGR00282 family metallophosphoesterase [Candidatus Saccharimonadales bacterium]
MRILYLGDVMASPGLQLLERELPGLRTELQVDMVIAQAENLSDGKGIRVTDFERLQAAGVDFCTGGNHTFFREEIYPQLTDPEEPIVRPANYPSSKPGLGYKYLETPKGLVLVVSLLGQIVGRDADLIVDNPLQTIDKILETQKATKRAALVVNFHGDFSSEKIVIGHYLDGRASIVVGDHWHVPTADARVLPGGTAHVTDVGMCGVLNSSLGVTYSSIIPRWHDGVQTRNALETNPPFQINGLVADINEETGLATSAESLRRIYS